MVEINRDNQRRFTALYMWSNYSSSTGGGIISGSIIDAYFEEGFNDDFKVIAKPLKDISKEDAVAVGVIALQNKIDSDIFMDLVRTKQLGSESDLQVLDFKTEVYDEEKNGNMHYQTKVSFGGFVYDFVMYDDGDIVIYDHQGNSVTSEEYMYSQLSRVWVVDKLRELGYAVGWMGMSVEDLVNAGWMTLETSITYN